MQALIEQLDKLYLDALQYDEDKAYAYMVARRKAQAMLEEEKDAILTAYNNRELCNPEEYYNRTFNTKEK